MNGGPGGLAAVYGEQRRQGGGGGGFIERNGVFVPLQGTNPGDPLMGGYGYCDFTDFDAAGQPHTFHPGVDLNAGTYCQDDLGNAIVASISGLVLAVLPWNGASGEGNHLWVYYDDPVAVAPAWAHFDHLEAFALGEGARFRAGDVLGFCGATGGWDCAHAHCELLRYQPSSWWLWPYGWSRVQVEALYFDPGWWYAETVARAGGQEEDVRTTTTPEERAAAQPYFEQLGVPFNTETAIGQRACLAYYRDETRGPAMGGEYPATAPDGTSVTRQDFTAGTCEAKAQPDGGWWTGWAELNRERIP